MFGFFDNVLDFILGPKNQDPDIKEANYYAKVIISELTRMGKCYIKKTKDGQVFQQVQVKPPIKVLPDRIEIEINTSRMPYGVGVGELKDDKIIEGIVTILKRNVSIKHNRRSGFWYVVRRAGAGATKTNYPYTDLVPPASYKPDKTPLLIPIGRNDDTGDQVWRDLEKVYHLLVGGATGKGKTSLLHSIICWLIQHADPDHVQLLLVDLKEGLDFSRYGNVPHLVRPPVITPEGAHGALRWINDEISRRGELFRSIGAENIETYRRRSGNFLNNIVFVFDEIANLQKLKMTGQAEEEAEAWFWLKDGAQRARALGIHFIISTQRPSVKIIDGDIKMNFTARIGLGTATDTDSRVILDNNMATGLEIGDLVYQDSGNRGLLLRGPYTDTDYADLVIDATINHYEQKERRKQREAELEANRTATLIDDMLFYAVNDEEGQFIVDVIYQKFSDRTTRDEVRQIAIYLEEMDVLTPAKGRIPRMVHAPENYTPPIVNPKKPD